MKSIAAVGKDLGISDHMLRDWEKRGYLGEVEKIDGKRMYSDEQFEVIKFINVEVEKQRKNEIKRTEYSKIDEALLERFGGEVVVRKNNSPVEIGTIVLQQLETRDKEIQNVLGSILQELQKPVELPDNSSYENLLLNHQNLIDVHQKLVDRLGELGDENTQLVNHSHDLERETLTLKNRLDAMEKENVNLKNENAELKEKPKKKWGLF